MPLESVFSPPNGGHGASGPPFKAMMTVDPWAMVRFPVLHARPMAPPYLGAGTAARRLARGVAPHAPPPNLRCYFLVGFTGKFAGDLEWIGW